jgi:alkylation response protein AidB-like acyl-CoA dehydrogenase
MSAIDLDQILSRTRQVVRDVIAPDAAAVDREARWPERGLRALQAAGLGGLVVPEKYGGLGRGLLVQTQVCEIIGRECASTALCFGMHCVGAAVIAAKARPEQRPYLEAISQGRHLTTLALSESGVGVHFYFPQTRLMQEGAEAFRVSGGKDFVTSGGYADSYVVSTVAAGPGRPADEFSCVVIPKDAKGLVWGPPWAGLGLRGNQSRSVLLQNVSVPRSDLLGSEGDEIWYVFQVVAPYFLIAMGGTYLGVAQAALDTAREHLARRKYAHSGQALSQVTLLQHRLGLLWAQVERTRRLVYWAAEEADEGGPDALPGLCAAKAEVADCAVGAVNEAMTLCGGKAFREDEPLGRLLRDARAAHVMSPTTDILLTWAGRALLGEPLLGD